MNEYTPLKFVFSVAGITAPGQVIHTPEGLNNGLAGIIVPLMMEV